MGLLGGPPSKAALMGLKKVRIGAGTYTIRKLNPLLDFSADDMPQIFSSYRSRRKPAEPTADDGRAAIADMYKVIEAAVVEPKLVPVGKGDRRGCEDGITAEDLFRYPNIGSKLYWEIINHSLNHFTGLKGIFFSLRTKYALWTLLRGGMADSLAMSLSQREG